MITIAVECLVQVWIIAPFVWLTTENGRRNG